MEKSITINKNMNDDFNNYNCTKFTDCESFSDIQDLTPIQQFYKDQTLFITGGTGFLGKILIEKLLRSCPGIARIYLLLRPKKGKSIENRLTEIFEDPIFEKVNNKMPIIQKKVIAIPGDCNSPKLGIDPSDYDLLINEVSIIFHLAATVRFNERLQSAANINIKSTAFIIDMSKLMPNLKSFIHVSTVFANCIIPKIEEKFVDYRITSDELLEVLQSNPDDKTVANLIKPWPNTYTFTKAMTEDLVKRKSKNLPMGIFRPAILTSVAKEPLPGWVDNYYGPMGVISYVATGLMRTLHCDGDAFANLVPVDITANALIASAWDVAVQTNRREDKMLIYNHVSVNEAPLTWSGFATLSTTYISKYPVENSIWYRVLEIKKYRFLYLLETLFLQWIPAIFMVLFTFNTKLRLHKKYEKVQMMSNAIAYFNTNNWQYSDNNINKLWCRLDSQDKQIFSFPLRNFDWNVYFDQYIKGIRIYLLKEDLSNLEVSRIRYKRFYWLHQIVKILFIFFGIKILWSIISIIIN